MSARGYGVKKRSFYCRFPFTKADTAFTVLSLGMLTTVLLALATGQLDFLIYPHIEMCDITIDVYKRQAKKRESTPGENLAKQIIEQYNPKSVADILSLIHI